MAYADLITGVVVVVWMLLAVDVVGCGREWVLGVDDGEVGLLDPIQKFRNPY